MVAVPAWVWRFGSILRALIVGTVVGIVLGFLAFLGSGLVLAGLVALVIVTPVHGFLMARRMSKYWPEANKRENTQR